ncbi:MAG TPA: class I SAM-dependent methyltransferase, partial [Rhizobiales bacterium]|nr:class I SAM-dependent methyltransferase [Hyphomicrobiales bacterium]
MSDKTLLEQQLIATIKADGPITIEQYMATCLGDPEHGYYMSKDPFGRGGDFITSPEVSQMFGEAIGVWFATAWMMMGSPKQVNLIELGPGRGTLMADMLRATKVVQEFADAITVHMVDISPALRKQQGETLKGFPLDIHWHQRLEQVPAGPCLIAANEFFDALPIKQYIRTENGWFERMVEVDENDQLVLGISLDPVPAAKIPQWAKDAEPGDIAEVSPQRFAMAEQIGTRLAKNHGAALIVDYGHALSFIGDTFQAVSKHKFVDVLYKPGQSDLTSHVDFQALAEGFTAGGATVHDLRTQRAFLIAMGLRERLAMLRKNAGARDRIMLSKQADRLIGEKLMGNLFKVLAVTSKELGT